MNHLALFTSQSGLRLAATALLCVCSAATAQYKVVGTDGRVTYTDRPPVADSAKAKVSALKTGDARAASTSAPLPLELRQIALRYPVTLYSTADCTPCEAAREWLVQRGVPYSEKRISSDEDGAALQRLVGARTVPSLTIGSQALRGFAPTDWASYIDAAGYPRESRLPTGWQPPAAVPLVARVEPKPAPAPAPVAAAPAPRAPDAPVAQPPGLRF